MKHRLEKRKLSILIALLMAATGLSSCGSGGSSDSLTIEVDYAHDEFAGSFFGFYPSQVTVKPGMTLKFHQTWTGQPHTVTLGTRVAELSKPFVDVVRKYWANGTLDGPPPDLSPFEEGLPFFFGPTGVTQTAAQPCTAKTFDEVPTDGAACADKTIKPFTGQEAYHSSGFIPFEGPRGNTFELPIADDVKPGTYVYYCNLHGLQMGGEITVTSDGEASKQSALNRVGKREADNVAKQLLAVYRDEKAGKSKVEGNLSGSGDERTEVTAGIVNEFTPRTIETEVGEKVTWTFIQSHSISFKVPPYQPIYTVTNGAVAYNLELDKTEGGWPGRTPPIPDDLDFGATLPPVSIDAGEYDGSGGLKSSGTEWVTGDKYSVTFTKKGTYPYACVIHPGMIGKVVVK